MPSFLAGLLRRNCLGRLGTSLECEYCDSSRPLSRSTLAFYGQDRL